MKQKYVRQKFWVVTRAYPIASLQARDPIYGLMRVESLRVRSAQVDYVLLLFNSREDAERFRSQGEQILEFETVIRQDQTSRSNPTDAQARSVRAMPS